MQLHKLDDYSSELRVVDDSNQLWHCHVHHFKYRYLREGQYVRIRSATLQHHDRCLDGRSFGLKSHSNILSLPASSQQVQGMKLHVDQLVKDFERDTLKREGMIMHPIVISKLKDAKSAQLPITSLDQILESTDEKSGPVRARFSVMHILPEIGAQFKPESVS